MAADSVAAIVTDPPYHLTSVSRGDSQRSNGGAGPFGRRRVGERGFMGQTWDGGDVAFDPETWAECYRVLKEGGRMLVFGGSRTHHRIWCAIEDAGFVIEDTIMWLYGSGFPKHKSKLKPAFEPICVARKGGVSALNVDDCRISTDESLARPFGSSTFNPSLNVMERGQITGEGLTGRWPANVVLDDEAAGAARRAKRRVDQWCKPNTSAQ